MNSRRFPPPWSIDELEACLVVIDGAGQKLAYVYFEDEPGLGPGEPVASMFGSLLGRAKHEARKSSAQGANAVSLIPD